MVQPKDEPPMAQMIPIGNPTSLSDGKPRAVIQISETMRREDY
jgi:hypothetical protein